jgi:hypothetical protein
MKICLYNTPGPGAIKEGSFDKIIWCPLSGDVVNIIQFFRNKYAADLSLHIENVFKKYLEEDTGRELLFFDADKIPTVKNERLIAFYSQSDTLANNTLCLISENPNYRYISYIPTDKAENADSFFEKNNIEFIRYSYRHLKKSQPDLLVLYNDWTKAAIRIISQCHLLGIPVVCIQESIINFGDSFKRMQRSDDVMIQGVRSSLMLPRRQFYLTGNPRYYHSDESKNAPEYALINCNFTYNIYDRIRTGWLDDVTSALDELGINYIISQHPRDNGDLNKYKNVIRSSSTGLDEQLKRAGLLITRFSSLIHESLIRGVPVIYYNPHNEKMHYDFGFNPGFLAEAGNKNTLKESVSSLYKKNISGKELESYLNEHCLPAGKNPVSNINYLLSGNKFSDVRFSFSDLLRLILYHPFILKTVRKIKKILPESPEPED